MSGVEKKHRSAADAGTQVTRLGFDVRKAYNIYPDAQDLKMPLACRQKRNK
jgi:hypothetical protein